jgi:hypothetical protein
MLKIHFNILAGCLFACGTNVGHERDCGERHYQHTMKLMREMSFTNH